MQAVKDNELKEINTFTVPDKLLPKGEEELLKSAIIFGGNASGKTNIIKAISYMRNVVLSSASQYPIVQMNQPYAFYQDADREGSLYEVEIIQNGTYYRYGFIISEGKIKEEWLDRRKEKLVNVFKRVGSSIDVVGINKQASKVINLSPNALFLSGVQYFNLDIADALNDVMVWFNNLLIVFENQANSLDIYTLEGGKYKDEALRILQLADIGIKRMEVRKDKIANMADFNDVMRLNTQMQANPTMARGQIKQEDANLFNIDMRTYFKVFNAEKNYTGKEKHIDLFKDAGFHSEGTIRLLCYLGWLLVALDKGMVVLVDEVDSKLHFLVADYLLKMFNSIDKNPKNAQLICTAHNIMLMDEDFRRDQIYFTSKDSYGESHLVALSDFKNVRKTDLFSKKYLAGFYSKLPDMND